jgi:CRP/FNR family transcriptional regulator, cyclic AMP receptor protein
MPAGRFLPEERLQNRRGNFNVILRTWSAAYRNARVEADLVDQLFNSSEKRLAKVLLLMAHFGKARKPEPIIAVSQETLAEMIGTTRSRVSTFMNKFRKLGFIDYNGALEVHNSLLNVVLHDNPHLRRKED